MRKRNQLSHLSHCYLGLYYLQMTCALYSLCNYITKLFVPQILTTHMYGNRSTARSFENIKLLCHSLNILQQFTLRIEWNPNSFCAPRGLWNHIWPHFAPLSTMAQYSPNHPCLLLSTSGSCQAHSGLADFTITICSSWNTLVQLIARLICSNIQVSVKCYPPEMSSWAACLKWLHTLTHTHTPCAE